MKWKNEENESCPWVLLYPCLKGQCVLIFTLSTLFSSTANTACDMNTSEKMTELIEYDKTKRKGKAQPILIQRPSWPTTPTTPSASPEYLLFAQLDRFTKSI